jgi:phage head maturation protease
MPLQTLDRADVKDGFISGVASTPSTDAFGHSVCAGAFDRSIKAKGLGGPKGVKLLAGHDWAKLIGVITRLEAVGDALRIEVQLNLDIG